MEAVDRYRGFKNQLKWQTIQDMRPHARHMQPDERFNHWKPVICSHEEVEATCPTGKLVEKTSHVLTDNGWKIFEGVEVMDMPDFDRPSLNMLYDKRLPIQQWEMAAAKLLANAYFVLEFENPFLMNKHIRWVYFFNEQGLPIIAYHNPCPIDNPQVLELSLPAFAPAVNRRWVPPIIRAVMPEVPDAVNTEDDRGPAKEPKKRRFNLMPDFSPYNGLLTGPMI